jgi:hypothetical protein
MRMPYVLMCLHAVVITCAHAANIPLLLSQAAALASEVVASGLGQAQGGVRLLRLPWLIVEAPRKLKCNRDGEPSVPSNRQVRPQTRCMQNCAPCNTCQQLGTNGKCSFKLFAPAAAAAAAAAAGCSLRCCLAAYYCTCQTAGCCWMAKQQQQQLLLQQQQQQTLHQKQRQGHLLYLQLRPSLQGQSSASSCHCLASAGGAASRSDP